MIYGGQRAAQQYNEMMRRMREHTNPQSYLNNIISSIKSTSKKALNNGTDFVLGASYRATDNISFGAWNNVNPYGDPQYHSKSYQAGAVFADLLTTIEGAITTGGSVTGGVAVIVGSGGTASVVAVPAAVAGAAYGGAMSIRSAGHLGDDLNSLFSKSGGKGAGNERKTSQTFGQPIETVFGGKKVKLRVDAEPDGNKIQIQAGKGKKSDVDIRINLNLPLENQIPKNLKRSLTESQYKDLLKNLQRAVEYLK
jgi:hypothetical protein